MRWQHYKLGMNLAATLRKGDIFRCARYKSGKKQWVSYKRKYPAWIITENPIISSDGYIVTAFSLQSGKEKVFIFSPRDKVCIIKRERKDKESIHLNLITELCLQKKKKSSLINCESQS